MPNQNKTALAAKIGLVLAGIIFTFVLLEILLRLGGWLFLTLQENKNQSSLGKTNEIRILCLGESTTALGGENSYPRQLEQILNSAQNKIKFSVINKGTPAITTTYIADHLAEYLNTYQPQIVVTMMGINDPLGALFEKSNAAKDSLDAFLQNFRVYKLFRLLEAHLKHKKTDQALKAFDAKLEALNKQISAKPTSNDYLRLAGLYRARSHWDKERATLQKSIQINPGNYSAWYSLGTNYRRSTEFEPAIASYKNALKLSPPASDSRAQAYLMLAETYRLAGQFANSAQTYQQALSEMPQQANGAYVGLGELYLEEGQVPEAQKFLEKQIELSPGAVLAYRKLAHCYITAGDKAKAKQLLSQGIAHNPNAAELYKELSAILIEDKDYSQAQAVLEKALALDPQEIEGERSSLYINLEKSYAGQGKDTEAKKIRAVLQRTNRDYSGETYRNYQKVRKILRPRGIKLVAVQYPMRSVTPLREILEPLGETLLVNNEKIFRAAVAQKSYDYYFSDRFAGDFGHCTPEGNRLLAQNIAETILKISIPE